MKRTQVIIYAAMIKEYLTTIMSMLVFVYVYQRRSKETCFMFITLYLAMFERIPLHELEFGYPQ